MRNTTGVHDVPSVPLFPMGTWYKQDCSGHMGHGGTVTLYKQYSIPSVPVCPVSPTVPPSQSSQSYWGTLVGHGGQMQGNK